jgi:hypothetical protein
MTPARREALQWFALLAGPAAWTIHLVAGFEVTDASCSAGLGPFGHSAALVALTVAAALVVVLAEGAAIVVFRSLRDVPGDAPGPAGRQRFLAFGAMVGNVLMLGAIVLAGIAATAHSGCRGA